MLDQIVEHSSSRKSSLRQKTKIKIFAIDPDTLFLFLFVGLVLLAVLVFWSASPALYSADETTPLLDEEQPDANRHHESRSGGEA